MFETHESRIMTISMPATSTSTSSDARGAAAAAKDAIALAIRRRNAALTMQTHSNTLAFAEDADVTRKLSFSGVRAEDDDDATNGRVQVRFALCTWRSTASCHRELILRDNPGRL